MFQLFTILKEHQEWKDGTITQEEIDIASGKTDLDSLTATNILKELDQKAENIHKVFAHQEAKSIVHGQTLSFKNLYLYKFTIIIRVHRTRKNLSDFLLVGSLLVTSHLMRLRNWNFTSYLSIHTTLQNHSRSLVAMQSKDM